ncbi:unnamed protein product [Alopecurus aequalis]
MKLDTVRRRRHLFLKVDRLTKLPDDMLLNILERVGTLDAIRASVVSKRMLNLPAKLSQIDIVLSYCDLLLMNDVVADVIDKLTMSPENPLCKLKVRFILKLDDCISIGKSVALAMATHRLDAAEFEILTPSFSAHCTNADLFLNHCGQQLHAFVGECPDAFAGLTRLHLHNLRFGQSDIPNILTTCKRLESLSFFECDAGFRSLLQVEHARLVELDVSFGKFSTVELNCLPNLQRFTYNSWHCRYDPLVLGFVPQLSKLALSSRYDSRHITLRLSHLLVNVPSISNLHLDFQSAEIWIQPESQKLLAPLLRQLRLVNLDNLPEECDIAWTMFFLEAAPSLQELCITVWDHKCQRQSYGSHLEKTDVKWEPSVADFKHKNLAKLTIHGFRSDDNFTNYVRRILEVAVNIKDVSLHDKLCRACTEKLGHLESEVPSSRYPQTEEEKDSKKEDYRGFGDSLSCCDSLPSHLPLVTSSHRVNVNH